MGGRTGKDVEWDRKDFSGGGGEWGDHSVPYVNILSGFRTFSNRFLPLNSPAHITIHRQRGNGTVPSSVSDPDWIRIQSVQWRAKMYHKRRKKNKKFYVLKCWMFSFESLTLLL